MQNSMDFFTWSAEMLWSLNARIQFFSRFKQTCKRSVHIKRRDKSTSRCKRSMVVTREIRKINRITMWFLFFFYFLFLFHH